MPDLILLTKPDCQKCDYVKERMPKDIDIQILDATTPDGMVEAAFYEVLEKPTPILIMDGRVITGAINILSAMNSLIDS